MFEGMSETEARAQILEVVGAYCDRFHNQQPAWREGDRINYAGRVYDRDEMVNLVDASLEFWLTSGEWTRRFEEGLGSYLGLPFVSFVNSGSSANLLAFQALTSPLLGERAIRPGDEVITVAAGFPTTVSPLVNFGAVPVFVDVEIPSYNVDVSQLEAALSEKTRAVMLAHTLGNPFDVKALRAFCDDHGLWLVEDNCDALGSTYTLDGEKRLTGTFGDIATSSFYPPHHMTTGEGGAVYTANPELHKIVRSLRDWGRDCSCPSGHDNSCGHRWDGQDGLLPKGYDHKYVYSHFGYNLKATDLQAAIGCAQLEKLPSFTAARKRNWAHLRAALDGLSDRLVLPEPEQDSDPSWFGFCITAAEGAPDAMTITRRLEQRGIQTRRLFAGNLVKHPCFDALRAAGEGYRIIDPATQESCLNADVLAQTERIMENTFWVGVYPGMTDDKLDFMARAIREAL
jgi:CDP-6-deoxy-D-xylo-4-hexulose-3-dehydrase